MSDDILYDLRHKQRLQEPRDMHTDGVLDAARYRFLRAESQRFDPVLGVTCKAHFDRNGSDWCNIVDLDATVDRCMNADPTPAPQPQCACEYYWPGQGHHPDCPTRATDPTDGAT